jgi:ABC-type transport system substrate-binding protein
MNKKVLSLCIVVLFGFSMMMGATQAQETAINIVFNINLLSPNTSPARNQWSLLMEQTLPKIGIGITFHESTGWGNIGPRTWSYPVGVEYDYVPLYEFGGYDLLFVGWSWSLDLNLQGLYEASAITPNGDNHYQYNNPTYDALLADYMAEFDIPTQLDLAKQLQGILYEDQPAIPIIYARSLFGLKDNLEGIDHLLLASSGQRMEYWDDPDDHIIKYGIPADLREPNVFAAESFYDWQWMYEVYGCPMKREQGVYTWENEIASAISTDVDLTAGTQTFEVQLDAAATFSDGSPVLPEDLVYSYQVHMMPNSGSSAYSTLVYWFGDNSSIEVSAATGNVAGGNVTFEMTGPFNLWQSLLEQQILDKSDVEPRIAARGWDILNTMPFDPADTFDDGLALVKSCGPMMITDFDTVNSVVKLEPNPFWHGTPVKLTEFYLTFVSGKDTAVASLIAGDIDIMDAQYFPDWTDFEGLTGIQGVLVKDPGHQEMSINMLHPQMGTGELTPLGTPEAAKWVRKAISHACPRQIIVEEIMNGLAAPATTPVPDAIVGYDDTLEPYAYDLDLAIDYMEDAGFDVITEVPTEDTGITGLVFLSFLGLAALEALRRRKK